MKITIVGAGAIGGWFGVSLASAGHAVTALARGETLAILRTRPWRLSIGERTIEHIVAAESEASRIGPQNLVIITVKGPALEALAPDLTPLIGQDTVIIPAMNGVPWWFLLKGCGDLVPTRLSSVDPHGTIESSLPIGHVVAAVVHGSVSCPAPGHAVRHAGNKVILGEPFDRPSNRVADIVGILNAAGLSASSSATIRRDIWYKLWGNITMNPISALTGATGDRIIDDAYTRAFILSVMEEVQSIGERINCPTGERSEDRVNMMRKMGAFKTSMLQDVEAKKALEIDQLLAAPLEIARALDLPAPNIATLLGLTRLFGVSAGLYGRNDSPIDDR
jgi:2-dehydropantoate 2-reductase